MQSSIAKSASSAAAQPFSRTLLPAPSTSVRPLVSGLPQLQRQQRTACSARRQSSLTATAVCQADVETTSTTAPPVANDLEPSSSPVAEQSQTVQMLPISPMELTAEQPAAPSFTEKRRQRKLARQREQVIYQTSAIAASLGVTSLAVAAVYMRFHWHMSSGGEFPWAEAAATLLLTFGGAIGMELWAQYAHKALWHDFEPGWALHKSHHQPRLGPFEKNDVFAVVNAIPAMSLCAYGFLTPGVGGGLCFGTGLGITLFGISYMFIHDGLVHRRFPVGPIAEVPYLKRVAIAHKLHHSEKYDGVPWGLFLGPMELAKVGGKEELDRMVAEHNLASKS